MKFSERNGFNILHAVPIVARQEASLELRGVLINTALECGFHHNKLREVVCQVLQKRADTEHNWGNQNIEQEVRGLIDNANGLRSMM